MDRGQTKVARPKLRHVEARRVRMSGREMVCLYDPFGLNPEPVYLSPQTFFVVSQFDGRQSLRDIQASYMRTFGTLLFTHELLDLVRRLDESLFLDSPRYETRLGEDRASFARAKIRRATHAGSAYPADPADLSQALDHLLRESGGEPAESYPPGAILEGALLPHIDLGRGAPVYGSTYAHLSALGGVPVFVIFGTSHAGLSEEAALTRKSFETPLGRVETDRGFVEALVGEAGAWVLRDEYAHRHEHSIEIQAVLLQHAFGRNAPFRIVPVLCGLPESTPGEARRADDRMETFAAAMVRVRRTFAERSAVVASADLAHLGPQFGDPHPVSRGGQAMCEEEDRKLLDRIADLDADGFLRSVLRDGNRRRICGLWPIYALLKAIEPSSPCLVSYHQAVDREGLCLVSFAGMVFHRSGGES